MVHKKKSFVVDDTSLKSIKKAEREKWKLECNGYRLKSTKQVGLDKFKFEYEK